MNDNRSIVFFPSTWFSFFLARESVFGQTASLISDNRDKVYPCIHIGRNPSGIYSSPSFSTGHIPSYLWYLHRLEKHTSLFLSFIKFISAQILTYLVSTIFLFLRLNPHDSTGTDSNQGLWYTTPSDTKVHPLCSLSKSFHETSHFPSYSRPSSSRS